VAGSTSVGKCHMEQRPELYHIHINTKTWMIECSGFNRAQV
jgi:hypothetical protein